MKVIDCRLSNHLRDYSVSFGIPPNNEQLSILNARAEGESIGETPN